MLLKKVQETFPYFQIPHVLAARYEFLKNPELPSKSLGFAALNSPDRIWLKKLVEQADSGAKKLSEKEDLLPETPTETQDSSLRTHSLMKLNEGLKGTETPKPKAEPKKRRKPPKDDLIETIKRKEKKEIVDVKKREQIDLIRAFSKKDIKLATIKEIEANQNTENLAAASTKINEHLMSESYARILANQGKKEMAIKIYEKLLLKFPDKRAYFADLIEKLKA